MRRWLLLLAVLVAASSPVCATTLTGSIKLPDTSTATGRLSLRLSQVGVRLASGGCGGPAVLVPRAAVEIPVAGGALQGSPSVIGNDCISPSGTYYVAEFRSGSSNDIVFTENWQITGASVDIGTLLPVAVPQGSLQATTVYAGTVAAGATQASAATLTSLGGFTTGTVGGLLNSQSNAGTLLEGDGTNKPFFSYTVPADAVANLKALRVYIGFVKTGASSVTYQVSLNGQLLVNSGTNTAGAFFWFFDITRTGTTTGVYTRDIAPFSTPRTAATLTSLAWTSSQTLQATFGVACCSNTVEPVYWAVELIQ